MSAQQLLDNRYFNELLGRMTVDIYDQWRAARTIEDRERLYHDKNALESVHQTIINQAKDDARESQE